jgi:hypothetical protein
MENSNVEALMRDLCVEAMLAAQMAVTHTAMLESAQRLMSKEAQEERQLHEGGYNPVGANVCRTGRSAQALRPARQ